MERHIFCPGNCTRYDLVYGAVPDAGYLLVWLHKGGSGGTAFRFDGDSYIHSSYLMEKIQVGAGDAAALLAFLRLQGHPTEVCAPFDAAGVHVGHRAPATLEVV